MFQKRDKHSDTIDHKNKKLDLSSRSSNVVEACIYVCVCVWMDGHRVFVTPDHTLQTHEEMITGSLVDLGVSENNCN